jgi:hypothetical protein
LNKKCHIHIGPIRNGSGVTSFLSTVNYYKGKRNIVHVLSYVVKCTVTDSPFNTQANCSKCPPSVHSTT